MKVRVMGWGDTEYEVTNDPDRTRGLVRLGPEGLWVPKDKTITVPEYRAARFPEDHGKEVEFETTGDFWHPGILVGQTGDRFIVEHGFTSLRLCKPSSVRIKEQP